jgi:hypothetical protein
MPAHAGIHDLPSLQQRKSWVPACTGMTGGQHRRVDHWGRWYYNSKNPARKSEQKKPWFRNGQRWRSGCEGRISVSKRRHGLNRCRYRGDNGMKRWVGLGVISDNLINIGRAIEHQPAN